MPFLPGRNGRNLGGNRFKTFLPAEMAETGLRRQKPIPALNFVQPGTNRQGIFLCIAEKLVPVPVLQQLF